MARATSKTGAKKATTAGKTKKKTTVVEKKTSEAKAQPTALSKAEVISPIQQLRSEIDNVFEDFSRNFSLPTLRSRLQELGGWQIPRLSLSDTVAPMDISETDDAITVSVELPGMDARDVEVAIADDMLTISGEKSQDETKEEGATHVHERSYGAFSRSFRLPPEADADNVEASFEKGLLTVSVPKLASKKAASKKIAVQSKS